MILYVSKSEEVKSSDSNETIIIGRTGIPKSVYNQSGLFTPRGIIMVYVGRNSLVSGEDFTIFAHKNTNTINIKFLKKEYLNKYFIVIVVPELKDIKVTTPNNTESLGSLISANLKDLLSTYYKFSDTEDLTDIQ